MQRRYLQFDEGIATGELTVGGDAGDFDPDTFPAGRVMVDVTDRPDARMGCRLIAHNRAADARVLDGDDLELVIESADRTW